MRQTILVTITFLLISGAFYSCTVRADDSVTRSDDSVLCKAEIHRVGTACKKSKKTERCRAAIADLNLCLAEAGDDDPIKGLDTCTTVCYPRPLGQVYCVTTCYDDQGRPTAYLGHELP